MHMTISFAAKHFGISTEKMWKQVVTDIVDSLNSGGEVTVDVELDMLGPYPTNEQEEIEFLKNSALSDEALIDRLWTMLTHKEPGMVMETALAMVKDRALNDPRNPKRQDILEFPKKRNRKSWWWPKYWT
jgi:hypothetical protein